MPGAAHEKHYLARSDRIHRSSNPRPRVELPRGVLGRGARRARVKRRADRGHLQEVLAARRRAAGGGRPRPARAALAHAAARASRRSRRPGRAGPRRQGGHRGLGAGRRRRPAPDDGRDPGRAHGGARQQGNPGDGRTAHDGRCAGARREAPAGRFRAQRGLPVPGRPQPDRRPPHSPHGVRGAVPRDAEGAPGDRHGRRRAPASDVEDGGEDHDRLGHLDEQGARGDRGALAVRRRVRSGASRRAPDGRVHRRLRDRPAGRGRHGRADPLRAHVSRAAAGADRAARSGAGRPAHVLRARPRQVPVSATCARRARLSQLGTGGAQRRQRGCGGGVPRPTHRLQRDRRADRERAQLLARGRARLDRGVRGRRRRDPGRRPERHRRAPGRSPLMSVLVFLADRVGVFIVVLGILILIHELGHFFVARWTGVGVERFSIGFGPVLARWRGPETEYCLSAIPMGGYVKMMGDENALEGGGSPVVDPHKAFAMKPLWARFLIVFAGPGMNFVLAWVIFTVLLASVGRPVWPAVLGRVTADGPAAAAGLQTGDDVTAIDGRPIQYWEDLERATASSDGRPLRLTIKRGGEQREVQVTPRRIVTRDPLCKESREVWKLGTGPQVTPQVGMVSPDSPAERAGLRIGDVVAGVGGQPVFTSDELTQAIQQAGGKPIDVVVQREGKPLTLSVTANKVKEKSETGQDVENWRIGVILASKVVRSERYNPVAAAGYGAAKTWELTALTVKVLWKFVKLELPLSNLGGPIQIATESHRQRQEGLAQLAGFTAFISVNLAVLNLLPVPMLDGGHLLFFVIEGILGRPVSLKKREAAQQLGLVLLLLLMVFAIYNDLVRIDAFRIFR